MQTHTHAHTQVSVDPYSSKAALNYHSHLLFQWNETAILPQWCPVTPVSALLHCVSLLWESLNLCAFVYHFVGLDYQWIIKLYTAAIPCWRCEDLYSNYIYFVLCVFVF